MKLLHAVRLRWKADSARSVLPNLLVVQRACDVLGRLVRDTRVSAAGHCVSHAQTDCSGILAPYSEKFINYDQKIVCTSTFRLPPEVLVRRMKTIISSSGSWHSK